MASKKQTYLAHPTMVAEFVALATTSKEAEWLRNMLLEWPQPIPPISLHCDSEAIMPSAFSSICNGKSRHISPHHDYVRELISNGIVTITYLKSTKKFYQIVLLKLF